LTLEQQINSTLKQLHDRKTGQNIIKYGYSILDGLTSGIFPTQLIIIGARPSVGKTAFALNVCMNLLKQQKKVLFVTLEMSEEELIERLICMLTGINSLRLKNPKILTKTEEQKIDDATFILKEFKLEICKVFTVGEIAKKIDEVQGVDLVIVDYLGLLKSSMPSQNKYTEISSISTSCKQLVMLKKTPMILLAQLNRVCEIEERMPRLSDLRDSGSIEQDADIVIFLHNKNEKKEILDNERKFYIAKQRNGAIGGFSIKTDLSTYRFIEG
jgi:replicative DNA helicase